MYSGPVKELVLTTFFEVFEIKQWLPFIPTGQDSRRLWWEWTGGGVTAAISTGAIPGTTPTAPVSTPNVDEKASRGVV